jgi:hypothetical protein
MHSSTHDFNDLLTGDLFNQSSSFRGWLGSLSRDKHHLRNNVSKPIFV